VRDGLIDSRGNDIYRSVSAPEMLSDLPMNGNVTTPLRISPSPNQLHHPAGHTASVLLENEAPLDLGAEPSPLRIADPFQQNAHLRHTRDLLLDELKEFRTALDHHAIVDTTEADGKISYVNDRFCEISKYSREELLGHDHRIINSGYHDRKFFQHMWDTIRRGEVWNGEIRNRAKDGSFYWEATTIVPLLNENGAPRQFLSIRTDITRRKLAEESLAQSQSEIKELKQRLLAESQYLKSEINTIQLHGEIIGASSGIKRVLHQVEQVAPADCTVLVTGETGTGKELVAQEIHRLSPRKDRPMMLVNCAALPSALVENELFGRERGAYTGALTSQVGRFQAADTSTIFLDEVSEVSMEVQAKLLRVLQQGEFQRLGSSKTHKVNVRVIAATNRDLAEDVRKGKFREDLYYRLKVFPIPIPPLRERLEDIPRMVFAFMEEFSMRMGKKITKISHKAMESLQKHPWPGNVRELRNVIEHSIILSTGDTLKLSFLGDSPTREPQPVTLADAEREHILKTLETTNWRIKGKHGAAERLDMEPSTLYSRMQKLGIPTRRQKEEQKT
jgi:PAS domain S-box-containing protein